MSLIQVPLAQFIGRAKVSKGPRAIGLIQILPNGKARLIPIAIMINGKFYDAAAYKAAPVPMALEQGTVYEAQKTGVSAGLFTVTLVGQTKDAWVAEGSWVAAGTKPAKTALRAETKPIMGDENDAPPTLRHGSPKGAPSDKPPNVGSAPGANTETGGTGSPAPEPTSTPGTNASSGAQVPSAQKSPTSDQPAASGSPNTATTTDSSDADTGPHPMLRRGSRGTATQADKIPVTSSSSGVGRTVKGTTSVSAGTSTAASAGKTSSAADTSVKVFPAISDANGPELRPFAYEAKPDEEARFRKTMLDLAADEVRARAKLVAGGQPIPEPPHSKTTTTSRKPAPKGPQPNFENVQLRIFDMSNSNEPTLVLSATAHMPSSSASATLSDVEYFVTVAGRWDINGDMHKIFARTTDSNHLDAISRVELIDAIDADGDNRGDLLFRQISDADTSYVIYRVSPDKLWPLFNSGAPEN